MTAALALDDIELLEQKAVFEARRDFWAYRRFVRPNMKLGWWQRGLARDLQWFFHALMAGERPILVIESPPQHGKTETVVDFVTWLAGQAPDLRTIYTSYSERLGIRANLNVQRRLDTDKYKKIFPETKISAPGIRLVDSQQATRNRELIEFINAEGFFRNTTVMGSITGDSLDVGIIDDPIKGRKEAGSKTTRDATWDWLTDDFFSRFSEEAGLIIVSTRWHVDDPIARFREKFDGRYRLNSFPAIAENDEEFRKEGEALFPEHKSLGFLLDRKALMYSANWEALYQRRPRVVGGEIIQGEHFKRYSVLPPLKWRRIYVDTAQKKNNYNDYSVFECWGLGTDNRLYLIDLIRGKWLAPELRRRANSFWAKHKDQDSELMGKLQVMKVEDKVSGTGLIQEIREGMKIPIKEIPRSIDKWTRASDVLGFIESSYICIPEDAPFVDDFVTECEDFTADDTHSFDDQLDPMFDAINDAFGKVGKKRVHV